MLRIFLVAMAAFIGRGEGQCQLKKFYTVKSKASYDTVAFSLKATSGTCFVKPSDNVEPLNIYGNPTFSDVNPTFDSWQEGATNYVNLFLEDYKKKGLSQAISYSMFGDDKSEENFWKMYLTEEKIYDLDFQYGVGDAYIDLSDLSVSKMKIESGSADVNIGYDLGSENKCAMDTFFVKVDLGTVVARNINLFRANTVIAEVGFGTAILDFSEGVQGKCTVMASVGAGKLKIIIPNKDYPAIVYFKNSPLCNMSMKTAFEEVDDDVFVNRSYEPQAENLLEFNIDVALGNIVFEYAK